VKALVTGATGLLGAHIVRALVEEGHSVRAFTRASSDLSGLEGLPFERIIGDVLDAESLRRAANGCEVLFHAATSFTYWGERLDDLEATAVEGTRHALDAAAAAGLPAISVSPAQGKLLHLLARVQGARNILEIGTLGGYSTIWLARALPAGGHLISLELDPKHAEVASSNVARAGLADRVEIRLGRAWIRCPFQ